MRTLVAIALLVATVACERERRDFKLPNGDQLTQSTRISQLQPGSPSQPLTVDSPLEHNAYALSEGKRLYSAYNCVGCHAQGGGGIGPALMDHRWIYGSRPDQIFSTIVQGRPNGMPAFGGRVPEQEVWQLVAYVESLSGNVPKSAAPGRNDDLQAAPRENSREQRVPVQTGHR
jgi:cytochrome c oxidase cbb3-type subunit III